MATAERSRQPSSGEALKQDMERQAAIAHKAYETASIPSNFSVSIVHNPNNQVGWHTDEDNPEAAYRIVVGTAPGWRHTALLERLAIPGGKPLEQPIAYLVDDDERNTVIFRDGDTEVEAHSGVVEPHDFNHAGIPSYAIELSRDTGPETLAKIEKAVELVHRGEVEAREHQRRMMVQGGSLEGL